MKVGLPMFLLALAVYEGWHWVPTAADPHAPGRVYYIGRGILGVALWALLARSWKLWGALFLGACVFGMLEETQNAVCGITAWGKLVGLAENVKLGICVDQFGVLPYELIFAAAIATATTLTARRK